MTSAYSNSILFYCLTPHILKMAPFSGSVGHRHISLGILHRSLVEAARMCLPCLVWVWYHIYRLHPQKRTLFLWKRIKRYNNICVVVGVLHEYSTAGLSCINMQVSILVVSFNICLIPTNQVWRQNFMNINVNHWSTNQNFYTTESRKRIKRFYCSFHISLSKAFWR